MLGLPAMDKIQAPPLQLQRGHLQRNECHLVVEAGSYLSKRQDITETRAGGAEPEDWCRGISTSESSRLFQLLGCRRHLQGTCCRLGRGVCFSWLRALLPATTLSAEPGHKRWGYSSITHRGPSHWNWEYPKVPFLLGKSDFTSCPSSYNPEINYRASLVLCIV